MNNHKDDNLRCEECDKDFGSNEALESHNHSKHYANKKSKHNGSLLKKILLFGVLPLIIIGILVFIFVGSNSSNPSNNNANTNFANANTVNGASTNDNVQIATLSVSGANYILTPSTFKKDVPVKIIADINSMPGCSKAVTIPAFSVLSYVSAKDNTITFTPTQTGTFKIACSMNMYTGTFTVN